MACEELNFAHAITYDQPHSTYCSTRLRLEEEISETDKKVKIQEKTRFHPKSAFTPPFMPGFAREKLCFRRNREQRRKKSASRRGSKSVARKRSIKRTARLLCVGKGLMNPNIKLQHKFLFTLFSLFFYNIKPQLLLRPEKH